MRRAVFIAIAVVLFSTQAAAQSPTVRRQSDSWFDRAVFRDPAFWANAGGAAGDMITTGIGVDGERIVEKNRFFATPQGTVRWGRFTASKLIRVFAPGFLYKKHKTWARVFMYASAIPQWTATAKNIRVIIRFK